MFRTEGSIFRKTAVTSTGTVQYLSDCYSCLPKDEPPGSKHEHVGDIVKN